MDPNKLHVPTCRMYTLHVSNVCEYLLYLPTILIIYDEYADIPPIVSCQLYRTVVPYTNLYICDTIITYTRLVKLNAQPQNQLDFVGSHDYCRLLMNSDP